MLSRSVDEIIEAVVNWLSAAEIQETYAAPGSRRDELRGFIDRATRFLDALGQNELLIRGGVGSASSKIEEEFQALAEWAKRLSLR